MDLNKGMKYKRALIPFGLASLVSPVVFVELRNVMWVAVLYFLGSFCLLINFPSLSITLHSKPLYVEDLIDERNDDRFKMVYEVLMIFLMSTMIAGFAEYIFLRNLSDRSPAEIVAILGGNLTIYLKMQNITGQIMLKACVCLRNRERSLSETEAREITT